MTERVVTPWASAGAELSIRPRVAAARGATAGPPAPRRPSPAGSSPKLDPKPEACARPVCRVGLFAAPHAVGRDGQVLAVSPDRTRRRIGADEPGEWRHTVVLPLRVDDAFGVSRPASGPADRRATRRRRPRRTRSCRTQRTSSSSDPPRTGAGADVVRAIAAARSAGGRLCRLRSAALARDAAAFAEAGYALGARGVTTPSDDPASVHRDVPSALIPAARW